MEIREIIESAVTSIAVEQRRRFAPLTDDLLLRIWSRTFWRSRCSSSNWKTSLEWTRLPSSENIQAPVTFGDFVALYENALVKEA